MAPDVVAAASEVAFEAADDLAEAARVNEGSLACLVPKEEEVEVDDEAVAAAEGVELGLLIMGGPGWTKWSSRGREGSPRMRVRCMSRVCPV